MTQIHDLGVDLQTSSIICKNGRAKLADAKDQLTQKVLSILSKYQVRNAYQV